MLRFFQQLNRIKTNILFSSQSKNRKGLQTTTQPNLHKPQLKKKISNHHELSLDFHLNKSISESGHHKKKPTFFFFQKTQARPPPPPKL